MFEVLLLLLGLLLLIKPVGCYLHLVYSGSLTARFAFVRITENLFAMLGGTRDFKPMSWKSYVASVLSFLLVCFIFVFVLLLCQPFYMSGNEVEISPALAFNITASFLTGTNIQTYIPEQTLGFVSQNFGLMLLQFIAPAIDMAVAVALFRSFASTSETIGNFWQDFIRGVIFVLIPAAFIVSLIYLSQGVVQSFTSIFVSTLIEESQEILTGPLASMQSISMLATNGGGFFASNAAHPFASPTPFIGFINALLIVLLPASFFYLYGLMIGDRKQSITLLLVIALCIGFFAGITMLESQRLPDQLMTLNIDMDAGNMEGKEQRFGAAHSALLGVLATATTNGAGGASYESFTPLALMSMMMQMMFGEVLLGGVGMGVINMLGMVIITVFLANLMIGRSSEYLRKKLGVFDIQLAVSLLVLPALFLFTAISLSMFLQVGTEPMQFQNVYGYGEALYAITSGAFNNGSSLGGINLNSDYYNILLAVGMLSNAMISKIIACALAGSIASKQKIAANSYHIRSYGVIFGILLLLVIILSALSYLPILLLGPVANYMGGI